MPRKKEKTQKDLLLELIEAVKTKQPAAFKPYSPIDPLRIPARSGCSWSKDEDIKLMDLLSCAVNQMAVHFKRSDLAIWYRIAKYYEEEKLIAS